MMVAKRFFYASAGLLLLTLAFEIGATTARGQATSFRVIGPATVVVGDAAYRLDAVNPPIGWHQLPDGGFTLPPVPTSSLVDYVSGQLAITDQGEGWGRVFGVWTDLGPIPGLVSVQPATWGQVKAKYLR